MLIEKTELDGVLLIKPKVFSDDRGYFFESFKMSMMEKFLPNTNFIQENETSGYEYSTENH